MAQEAVGWSIRSTLVTVSDLDRSTTFYRDVTGGSVVLREDQVAIVGSGGLGRLFLILREAARGATRHGQQSLGARGLTFDVGAAAELDRVEAQLRAHHLFRNRRPLSPDEEFELVHGHDPDGLPLLFVAVGDAQDLPLEHFRHTASLMYGLDM